MTYQGSALTVQTHYVVVKIISLSLNIKVMKHFNSFFFSSVSGVSLETTTVIYLTVTDDKNNKLTCLFLLSHSISKTAGFMQKIINHFLFSPMNLSKYQSKLQCCLLLHSLYMFTATPEKALMHARMCCSVKF